METDKKKLTEEDIKHLYITPAIEKRWSPERLRMEVQITDGKISLEGNMRVHKNPLKADYILYLNNGYPIAVVEAKDNNHTVSFGMQQAKTYATMMDFKFAYSSNGDGFQEYDFMTGKERSLGLDEFPSEEELIARYRNEINGGQGLTEAEETIIKQPYYSDQNTYPPRYYQRVAVNRTLDAIARGQDRILLVMATGVGKTLTAFQIVYRLLKARMKRKVLYLADRNILVDQTIQQDFKPLEKVVHKINFQKEDAASITAHQVYFGLYQQLIGDNDEQRFKKYFANNFFDLIIVDECHRGSAKDDSQWRCILDYFSGATQIGMTATPKETKYASNTTYFGDPVYEYSLNNGIEDGFLAPFRVIDVHMDISDGWRPSKGQRDYYGNEIEDRIYDNSDYDYKLVLQDRNYKVAEEITKYMTETNRRMDKTIVFCADEAHCEDCNCYYILNETFQELKKKGVILCRVMEYETYKLVPNNQNWYNSPFLTWSKISPLRLCGYCVNQNENLTDKQRQSILEEIVDNKILSTDRVMSYLSIFIDKIKAGESAKEKWKADYDYISNYKLGTAKRVVIPGFYKL